MENNSTDNKITKKKLVQDLATTTKMTQSDVDKVLEAFYDQVGEYLRCRQELRLIGFGTFAARYRKPTTARNPATGEEIQVSESYTPTFKPGAKLKSQVNP
jgi:DNA-binding protein HU-beta